MQTCRNIFDNMRKIYHKSEITKYVFVRISIHITKKTNLVSLKLEFSSLLIRCFLEDKTRNMTSEYVYFNFFRHSVSRSYWKLIIAMKSADQQGYFCKYLCCENKPFKKEIEWIIFFGICSSSMFVPSILLWIRFRDIYRT